MDNYGVQIGKLEIFLRRKGSLTGLSPSVVDTCLVLKQHKSSAEPPNSQDEEPQVSVDPPQSPTELSETEME